VLFSDARVFDVCCAMHTLPCCAVVDYKHLTVEQTICRVGRWIAFACATAAIRHTQSKQTSYWC
jgi:hypothetical protein